MRKAKPPDWLVLKAQEMGLPCQERTWKKAYWNEGDYHSDTNAWSIPYGRFSQAATLAHAGTVSQGHVFVGAHVYEPVMVWLVADEGTMFQFERIGGKLPAPLEEWAQSQGYRDEDWHWSILMGGVKPVPGRDAYELYGHTLERLSIGGQEAFYAAVEEKHKLVHWFYLPWEFIFLEEPIP